MSGNPRERLLRLLIVGTEPIGEIVGLLGQFGWDSEQELVVLTRADGLAMLDRYLKGETDGPNVVAWANAIEGREDIGYEADVEGTLAEFIFELANPALTVELTPGTASSWKRRLSQDLGGGSLGDDG